MSFDYIRKLPTPDEIREQYPVPDSLVPIKQKRDAEIRDVLTPVDRLDGDLLVGLANKFLLEWGSLQQGLGGGMPLFVGVLGEFGQEARHLELEI